ncbi:MAG: hypothetical protein U1E83_04500 [Methylotetracoccus sp.]
MLTTNCVIRQTKPIMIRYGARRGDDQIRLAHPIAVVFHAGRGMPISPST